MNQHTVKSQGAKMGGGALSPEERQTEALEKIARHTEVIAEAIYGQQGAAMELLHSIERHSEQAAKRSEYLERWDHNGLPGTAVY